MTPVRVVTAVEAAELDRRAIASGTPSRTLMQTAGLETARALLDRFAGDARRGVAVYAGLGNNGGDAWVVAGALARLGVPVRVFALGEPRTPDALAAREAARAIVGAAPPDGSEGVVVDGLLGTGASGAPRGAVAEAIERIGVLHAGAHVVAVDVPSGVDATTGAAAGAFVRATLTVTYGSPKRGLLVNRDAAGEIVVADIGLADQAATWSELPSLVDAARVRHVVPPITADAHKGTRKRLIVVGGAEGMAGASILAARAAMRSGIGMVRLCVAPASLEAVQGGEPAAMAAAWPTDDAAATALGEWAHAMLIGPGLGRSADALRLIERLLTTFTGPVVLDADALNAFEHQTPRLAALLGGRPAVLTPHEVEFSRLAGIAPAEVAARRFELPAELANRLHCTVLLKGVPTVVSDGVITEVCAAGTPVLATAGSGDVLGGVVATLLAQTGEARGAAAAGAWVHGRAAELAGAGRVRGVTLDDVVAAIGHAWPGGEPADGTNGAPSQGPWLAELPSVGERF